MSDFTTHRMEGRNAKPDFDPNSAWNQKATPVWASDKVNAMDQSYAVAIRHPTESHWRPHGQTDDFHSAYQMAEGAIDLGFFAVIWAH